jgi:hypothetical protein
VTTALEQEALPELYAEAKLYCPRATFTLYPNAAADAVESEVDLGASVTHEVVTLPPDILEARMDEDGSQIENEGIAFDMLTGAATAEAITFVPAIGQLVTFRGVQYFVRKVQGDVTGDHIGSYSIEARR